MIHRCLVLALVLIACGTAACGRSATLTQPTTTTQGSSFSIAGTIREHLPDGTSGPSIPGALVEVVGKAGVVRSATADDNGQYSIRDVGGSFDVRASKDGYKAETFRVGPLQESVTVDALIVPIPRTLIGIVTETFPTETVPIAGATVEVVSGYNKGASVSTDADGHFSLADVWGRFDVAISRAGYEGKTIPCIDERDGDPS